MDTQDGRVTPAFDIAARLHHQPFDVGAVPAFETDAFQLGEITLAKPIVMIGQRRGLSFADGPLQFEGHHRRAAVNHHLVAAVHCQTVVVAVADGQEFATAGFGIDFDGNHGLRIFDQRDQMPAVLQPDRLDAELILQRRLPLAAAGQIDHGQLPGRVVNPFASQAAHIGDFAPIWTPGRSRFPIRVQIGSRIFGDLFFAAAGPRLDGVDIPVQMAVRIGAALGHERDGFAIGGEGRQVMIIRTAGQRDAFAAIRIHQIQVLAAVVEITGDVFLELEAGGDDGPGMDRWLAAGSGRGIGNDDCKLCTGRRHREIIDTLGKTGDGACSTTAYGHLPDLGHALGPGITEKIQ